MDSLGQNIVKFMFVYLFLNMSIFPTCYFC